MVIRINKATVERDLCQLEDGILNYLAETGIISKTHKRYVPYFLSNKKRWTHSVTEKLLKIKM